MEQQRRKILTLDGGGIKGVFAAAFLETIEDFDMVRGRLGPVDEGAGCGTGDHAGPREQRAPVLAPSHRLVCERVSVLVASHRRVVGPHVDSREGCGGAGDVTREDVVSMTLGHQPHTQPLRA